MLRLRSSFPSWATLAFSALASLASASAVAQAAPTMLLGNLPHAETCHVNGQPDAAAHFRTGSKPLSVETIRVEWGEVTTPGTQNRVGIFAHNPESPARPSGTQVGGWKRAAGATQQSVMAYASSAPIALQPNTDYWVVVEIADNSRPRCTYSPNFGADPNAGNPTLSLRSAIGSTDTSGWPVVFTILTLAYALDGTVSVSAPDMSASLYLPATGTVGQPYAGHYTCQNVGTADAINNVRCLVQALPDGVSSQGCTISPSATPWRAGDPVPVAQTVHCEVSGTPTTATGVATTLLAYAQGDTNFDNSTARQFVTTSAAPPVLGPDMAASLHLSATGTVGKPYAGYYTCQNVGNAHAEINARCQVSGLPLGAHNPVCTISPGAMPWKANDRVPAGETVRCDVSGTPTEAASTNVYLLAHAQGDTNTSNNEARQSVSISAKPADPGGSPDPGNVQAVPSLTTWGQIALSVLLLAGGLGMGTSRRRS